MVKEREREREGERERGRERDACRHGLTDTQINRHINTQTHRRTDTTMHTDRQRK